MRILLILVVFSVLFFTGCVDEKTTLKEQPNVSSNAILEQEKGIQQYDDLDQADVISPVVVNDSQQTDAPNQINVIQPTTESDENTTASVTKETLQELEGLLEELQQGDFADIDFAE